MSTTPIAFNIGDIVTSTVSPAMDGGQTPYYAKADGDTWINLRNHIPVTEKDIAFMLQNAKKVSQTDLQLLVNQKIISLTHHAGISGMGITLPGGRSIRDWTLNYDSETSIERANKKAVLSIGIHANNGSVPVYSGFKGRNFEALFVDELASVDDFRPGGKGVPVIKDPYGLDLNLRGTRALTYAKDNYLHLGQLAVKVGKHWLNNPSAFTRLAQEDHARLARDVVEMDKAFAALGNTPPEINESHPLVKYRDTVIKLARLGQQKTMDVYGRESGMNVVVTPSGEALVTGGDAQKVMEGMDRVIGLHDDPASGSIARVRLNAFNLPFEQQKVDFSKLGHIDPKDTRGGDLLAMATLHNRSGLSLANHLGTMYSSLIKPMALSKSEAAEVFAQFSRGFGNQYRPGTKLNTIDDAVAATMSQAGIREKHFALADAQQDARKERNLLKMLDLIDKEDRGEYTAESMGGLSLRTRFTVELLKNQIAFMRSKQGRTPAQQELIYEQQRLAFDQFTPWKKTERAIGSRIEAAYSRNIGESLVGGLRGAIGENSVKNILAGAFLGTGIEFVAEKARQLFQGDDNQHREGIAHDSWMTMANRTMLTDFGSGWRGDKLGITGGLISQSPRIINALFQSYKNHEILKGDSSLIGWINNVSKDVGTNREIKNAAGELITDRIGVTSAIDRGFGRLFNRLADKNGHLAAVRTKMLAEDVENLGLLRAVARNNWNGLKFGLTAAGGAKGIAKASLNILGKSLFNNGKITGFGMFTGIGLALGLTINLMKGSYKPDVDYDHINQDKVKNDPRFRDPKRMRRSRHQHDTTYTMGDAMEMGSQDRQAYRRGMTDFGSSQTDRGTLGPTRMIGRVSPLPNSMASEHRLLETINPTSADMMSGGNRVQTWLNRGIAQQNRISLNVARRGANHLTSYDTPVTIHDSDMISPVPKINQGMASPQVKQKTMMNSIDSRKATEKIGTINAFEAERSHSEMLVKNEIDRMRYVRKAIEPNMVPPSKQGKYLRHHDIIDITSPKGHWDGIHKSTPSTTSFQAHQSLPGGGSNMVINYQPTKNILKDATNIRNPQELQNLSKAISNETKPIVDVKLRTSVTAITDADIRMATGMDVITVDPKLSTRVVNSVDRTITRQDRPTEDMLTLKNMRPNHRQQTIPDRPSIQTLDRNQLQVPQYPQRPTRHVERRLKIPTSGRVQRDVANELTNLMTWGSRSLYKNYTNYKGGAAALFKSVSGFIK